jgi:tetratricopeptide (TPR) repeat protein
LLLALPAPLAFLALLGPAVAQGPPSARELEQRVSDLFRRAADIPPGSAAAINLSKEFTQAGASYLSRGDSARAVELLGRAHGLDVENGLALAQLTLAYVRLENFETAAFYLRLAEEQSARSPPEIYGVLGEIYYSLNRLEDAVIAWEQFQRLGGDDPRALERLARAKQEFSLASGQRVLEGEDFSLYWDPAISTDTVREVSARLAASYREQSAFFDSKLPSTQIVVLYAGRTYFSLVSVPDWVSGVFDGKIRVSLDPDGGLTPELSSVLAHELAHALVRYVSADRAPGWLHEGLAQWWEGRRILRNEIREAFRGHPAHTLAEMEGNLARRSDRAAARTNYIQALALVEYLIERHGSGSVACLVRDLGEGRNLAEALRLETGLTPEELIRRWKDWAKL